MKEEERAETGVDSSASRAGIEPVWTDLDPHRTYEKLGYWLITLPEVIGWYYNAVYKGHSMKPIGDGWRLIVWADFGKQAMVCFTYHETPIECVRSLAYQIKGQRVAWKEDEYA